jgi:uncharacterized protein (TIGR02246 family)
MIKYPIFFAVLMISLSTVFAQEQNAFDQSLIETLFTNSLTTAWNNHDAKTMAENFSEDADFTNVRGMFVHGRKAIAAFHATLFSGMFKNTHTEMSESKVRFLRDNLAAVDISWTMSGAILPDETPWPNRKGIANAIVEKRDGKWLILILHNLDLTETHSSKQSAGKP